MDKKGYGHEDLEVIVGLIGGRVNDIVVEILVLTIGHDLKMVHRTMRTIVTEKVDDEACTLP
jgi:hypothetical protein